MIDICLLGCGGMMPLPNRRLTALLARVNGKMILFDCGEGTQVSVKQAGWGFSAIETICFTHYHADHIAGLPGLLSTLGNSGKKTPLKLFGPPGLRAVVGALTVIVPPLPFEVFLTELSDTDISEFQVGVTQISCIPVDHAMPCLSYRMEIKRAGKFDVEKASALNIPKVYWKRLQHGESIELGGRRFEPEQVLGGPRQGLKVCYSTDTRPTAAFADFCGGSDLLICEGMYGDEEKLQDAISKKHMMFSEAAALAKRSGAKELWLTHYSPSVKDPYLYLDAARRIFPQTFAGEDLMKKTLYFEEENLFG